MSQENVEITRAVVDAWNRGDANAIRELHDPGVIVRPIEGWPEPGPFVGREALLRWIEQLREAWDTDAMERRVSSTRATESSSSCSGEAQAKACPSWT
jgi:hypothetical protein